MFVVLEKSAHVVQTTQNMDLATMLQYINNNPKFVTHLLAVLGVFVGNNQVAQQASTSASQGLDQLTMVSLQKQITNFQSKYLAQPKSEDCDGIFTTPFSEEILNFPLPPDFKTSKFEMFNGEGDPKKHLINFQECILKLEIEEKLMAKFFPRSLKGDASQWFYKLPYRSITSFGELVKIFIDQYKHNIKHKSKLQICVQYTKDRMKHWKSSSHASKRHGNLPKVDWMRTRSMAYSHILL